MAKNTESTPKSLPGEKKPKERRQPGHLTLNEERRIALLEEALGLVLTPSQARKACKNLVAAFDSFERIFAAPEAVLRSIPGITEPAVRLLQLVIRLSQAYMEEQPGNYRYVYDTTSAAEAMAPKFIGRKTEAVALLMLDVQGRVVYNEIICEGSFSEVPLYLRQLLQLCIVYQVEDVYLAHNHPSGVLAPSENDLLMTDRLITALQNIGVTLLDHLIFAGDSYFSFQEDGVLKTLKYLVEQTQLEQLDHLREVQRRFTEEE